MTPWPDDFAAEWRAEERRRKVLTLAESLRRSGVVSPFAGMSLVAGVFAAAADLERERLAQLAIGAASDSARLSSRDFLRGLRIAAQAERLSVWRPWR